MRLRIDHIHVSVHRVPLTTFVETSFGIMRDRPAVFVKLTTDDGTIGWGEIFANWPAAGAEHRARLLIEDIADVLFAIEAGSPAEFWRSLNDQTRIRAGQCAEWGPFDQVIAGLDTAIHDVAARQNKIPLAFWLNPDARKSVPAYASGIPIYAAHEAIDEARKSGTSAFKVKVGFDTLNDLKALKAVAANLQTGERLFADANQAWSVDEALGFMSEADKYGLDWIEEPISAQSSPVEWKHLASRIQTPIAVGENIAGHSAFESAIASGSFEFIQPDVAKWGGVTGCFDVARNAVEAGLTYCPHFLGGGVGLIASAHLLAAVGGPGLLEVDVNPNPLRDAFLDGEFQKGHWLLGDGPGLGIDELPEEIMPYRTLELVKSRASRHSTKPSDQQAASTW